MDYNSKNQSLINFCLSKDLQLPLSLKVLELTGLTTNILLNSIHPSDNSNVKSTTDKIIKHKLLNEQQQLSLIVSIFIESGNGNQLTCPLITHLNYSINPLPNEPIIFKSPIDNWITLPIEYCQLPINATLVFNLYNYNVISGDRVFVGSGRLKLFDDLNSCTLLKGFQSLDVIPPKSLLENLKDNLSNSTNSTNFMSINLKNTAIDNDEDNRPEWLIKLTNSKLNNLKRDSFNHHSQSISEIKLKIELSHFDIPIVFSDVKYATLSLPSLSNNSSPNTLPNYDPSFNDITFRNKPNSMVLLSSPFDPDMVRSEQTEDPVEQKFRKLERTQHISPLDKELKPTLRVRILLSDILHKQFFEKLTAKEKNMIWKFRWFLLNSLIIAGNGSWGNFAINFIKCVDWKDEGEVKEFEKILKSLTSDNVTSKKVNDSSGWWVFIQELQIVDCLELLSGNYKSKFVRSMAVKRLMTINNEELSLFMVQLVQSIKHEILIDEEDENELVEVNDGVGDEELDIEEDDEHFENSTYTIGSSEYQVVDRNVEGAINNNKTRNNNEIKNTKNIRISNNEVDSNNSIVKFLDDILHNDLKNIKIPNLPSFLVDFIIDRSVENPVLTNFFYWSLKVEVDEEKLRNNSNENGSKNRSLLDNNHITTDSSHAHQWTTINTNNLQNIQLHMHIYETTMKKFISKLALSYHGEQKLFNLKRQIELVNRLRTFCLKIKIDFKKETTPKKIELLKYMLVEKHKRTVFGSKMINDNNDDSKHESMVEFPPLAIPLDPSVLVDGTFPEDSSVFKSSLNPLKLTFKTIDGKKYPIMYKVGDDLRQDQFVVQIILLMEKILQNENLDLKLNPYRILATGTVEGFIQFVPNSSLSSILAKYNNSILAYLQAHNPDLNSPLGVKIDVMDNYVRSCAGYCVVTYILGVGDRHLENLLLTEDGYFFHADFGYILGQDPKPFPPLMKLPIQIIEGMGGLGNENYSKFCNYCFITYITLRKNASLILNLVQLMINSSIPALRTSQENSESEKMEILWKVQEKFMLELNDEDAILHFQNLIDDSVNAFLPVVIDRLHSLAQYWRS